jgi:hypothetical protein
MKSHMHMLFVGLIVLLLCGLVAAQDSDILGDETCELIVEIAGRGNIEPVKIAISQNDEPVTAFEVADGEQSRYRLPPGIRSYRLTIVTAEVDEERYTLGAWPDEVCAGTVDPEQPGAEMPEDIEAWLQGQAARIPNHPEFAMYEIGHLRAMMEIAPSYGLDPVGFVQAFVDSLVVYHEVYLKSPTVTPAPTESLEPTAEPSQAPN